MSLSHLNGFISCQRLVMMAAVVLAVLLDQAVTEVEEEGDEAGGGDNGEDEKGGDVGRPGRLSLDWRAKLVAEITVAAPQISRLQVTIRSKRLENAISSFYSSFLATDCLEPRLTRTPELYLS